MVQVFQQADPLATFSCSGLVLTCCLYVNLSLVASGLPWVASKFTKPQNLNVYLILMQTTIPVLAICDAYYYFGYY